MTEPAKPIEVRKGSGYEKSLKDLRKKYRRIDADIERALVEVLRELSENPGFPRHPAGDRIPRTKHPDYKKRVLDSSGRRSKGGGFRIIYEWLPRENAVALLMLYPANQKNKPMETEIARARATAKPFVVATNVPWPPSEQSLSSSVQ